MIGGAARSLTLLMAGALMLGGCAQGAASPAASGAAGNACAAGAASGTQIPEIEAGKFNVAMVLIGPHDDGGWSQAHYEGLQYLCENVENTHVAYIENVPEGTDSEQTFRSLARKGFDFIIGTSFGYMDPMETVAGEYPDKTFLHLTGYKSNGKNFGNFFGAMEERGGGSGSMRGAKVTCRECTMDVVFINTWHDPIKEKAGATALFDAGAQVVFTGADTGANADVAQEKGKWAVTYDHTASCKVDACLTAPYWIWGPEYARIAKSVKAKTYTAGYEYFDADSKAMGLLGFMDGETPRKGVADLPAADVQLVKDTLAKELAGQFGRFDVFAGPIKDNTGKELLPAGQKLEQSDLDQFPPGAPGAECKTCMYWWNDGITAELPPLGN